MNEITAARNIIKKALAKGYTVSVNDGEAWTVKQSSDENAIVNALNTTGEDTLKLRDQNGVVGMIYLVWGNARDGSELVCDFSDNDAMNALI